MVVAGESGFYDIWLREAAEDDMVNVNTHVRSSMELPFGECTLFLSTWLGGFSVAAACVFSFFPLVGRFVLQPFVIQSSAAG